MAAMHIVNDTLTSNSSCETQSKPNWFLRIPLEIFALVLAECTPADTFALRATCAQIQIRIRSCCPHRLVHFETIEDFRDALLKQSGIPFLNALAMVAKRSWSPMMAQSDNQRQQSGQSAIDHETHADLVIEIPEPITSASYTRRLAALDTCLITVGNRGRILLGLRLRHLSLITPNDAFDMLRSERLRINRSRHHAIVPEDLRIVVKSAIGADIPVERALAKIADEGLSTFSLLPPIHVPSGSPNRRPGPPPSLHSSNSNSPESRHSIDTNMSPTVPRFAVDTPTTTSQQWQANLLSKLENGYTLHRIADGDIGVAFSSLPMDQIKSTSMRAASAHWQTYACHSNTTAVLQFSGYEAGFASFDVADSTSDDVYRYQKIVAERWVHMYGWLFSDRIS